jgi:hypothetical protein
MADGGPHAAQDAVVGGGRWERSVEEVADHCLGDGSPAADFNPPGAMRALDAKTVKGGSRDEWAAARGAVKDEIHTEI